MKFAVVLIAASIVSSIASAKTATVTGQDAIRITESFVGEPQFDTQDIPNGFKFSFTKMDCQLLKETQQGDPSAAPEQILVDATCTSHQDIEVLDVSKNPKNNKTSIEDIDYDFSGESNVQMILAFEKAGLNANGDKFVIKSLKCQETGHIEGKGDDKLFVPSAATCTAEQ